MVGRTPEYFGKKIEAREMKFAMLSLLLAPALVLLFSAVSVSLKTALDTLGNAGPHGFSEIFTLTLDRLRQRFGFRRPLRQYALVQYNDRILMFFGRLGGVVPIMAIAGSLAQKKKVQPSVGAFPTHGPLFVVVLIGVVLIVALLQFFPIVALGPLAEHFMLAAGKTF